MARFGSGPGLVPVQPHDASEGARVPALYLLRHGIAQAEGGDPPLSEQGVMEMSEEARGMVSLGLTFDAIVTSPLRRAAQTALIVAGALGIEDRLEICEPLSPGCGLPALGPSFDQHRSARAILLVGHQPDLGRIAADLIEAEGSLSLGRGDLCCLDVAGWPPRPPATLASLMSARFLRERAVQ